jgi:multidrug transporter EmrE-like cation transporter
MDPQQTRRLAILGVVIVVLLFAVELVALALGALEVAVACAVLLTIGWFVLRSHRRKQRAGP